MLPRSTIRNNSRTRSWLVLPLATVLALVLSGTLLTTPAHAANPVTPGNFRGLGFDQCEAPSQSAMSTWIKKSPFRAAGIYISGASRACQRQSNLNATWVRNQLAAGWHLMPITLGPQASCSTRYPRYGRSIDPTINPSSTNWYAAAKAQGKLEAQRAVRAARNLGIVPGSTLFYDLEAFDTRRSTSCTQSAIRFLHAWTRTLHSLPLRVRLLLQRRFRHQDDGRPAGEGGQHHHDAGPDLDRRLGRQGEHLLLATSAAAGGSPTGG